MEEAASRLKKKKEYSQSGFTLISVLIAVLIMGVMATVAVPKFTAALAAANTTKIQSDLAAIDTSIALYRIDKGVSPTKMEDLKDYLENYDKVQPPEGECNVQGERKDIPTGGYSISANTEGRMQAHLGQYTIYDFGGKKAS